MTIGKKTNKKNSFSDRSIWYSGGRLLTFHRYVYLHWRTDHLHSGHLNILPQFTSITATTGEEGGDWLCLTSFLKAENEICPRPRTWDEKHKQSLLKASAKIDCKMHSFFFFNYIAHMTKKPQSVKLIKGNTLHRIFHMYSEKLRVVKITLMTEILL